MESKMDIRRLGPWLLENPRRYVGLISLVALIILSTGFITEKVCAADACAQTCSECRAQADMCLTEKKAWVNLTSEQMVVVTIGFVGGATGSIPCGMLAGVFLVAAVFSSVQAGDVACSNCHITCDHCE